MTSSRQSLAEYLKSKLQDPSFKAQCDRSYQKAVTQWRTTRDTGHLMRLFDDFPNLMPEEEFQQIKQSFIALCKEISALETDNGILLGTEEDRYRFEFAVERWEKKLIHIAYGYLIDKDGSVRPEVIAVLGWRDFKPSLPADIALTAYVGAINNNLASDPEILSNQSIAICHHLNKNRHYRNWIIEKIEQVHPGKKITRIAREHPIGTIAAGTLTLGIFGLAAAVAAISYAKETPIQPAKDTVKPGT